MRHLLCFIGITLLLTSCHGVSSRAKQLVNKTGQTVGEGGTEFARGVAAGVEQAMESSAAISDALAQKGVSYSKFDVSEGPGTRSKNKLAIYLLFSKDFNGVITAIVYDDNGKEYGRAATTVAAKANDAKYIDFVFDQRTDVESKSNFMLE